MLIRERAGSLLAMFAFSIGAITITIACSSDPPSQETNGGTITPGTPSNGTSGSNPPPYNNNNNNNPPNTVGPTEDAAPAEKTCVQKCEEKYPEAAKKAAAIDAC